MFPRHRSGISWTFCDTQRILLKILSIGQSAKVGVSHMDDWDQAVDTSYLFWRTLRRAQSPSFTAPSCIPLILSTQSDLSTHLVGWGRSTGRSFCSSLEPAYCIKCIFFGSAVQNSQTILRCEKHIFNSSCPPFLWSRFWNNREGDPKNEPCAPRAISLRHISNIWAKNARFVLSAFVKQAKT